MKTEKTYYFCFFRGNAVLPWVKNDFYWVYALQKYGFLSFSIKSGKEYFSQKSRISGENRKSGNSRGCFRFGLGYEIT